MIRAMSGLSPRPMSFGWRTLLAGLSSFTTALVFGAALYAFAVWRHHYEGRWVWASLPQVLVGPGLGLMLAAMPVLTKATRDGRDGRRAVGVGLGAGILASSVLFGWMWIRAAAL